MATSEHTDEVEITASVAHSQEQPPLEPATVNAAQQGASIPVLDTSGITTPKPKRLSTSETLVNVSCPKKHEGPSESTIQYTPHQQPPQNLITPYLESMPSVVQGTEGIAMTSERSSTPGTSNVSIPEETASQQPASPEITGELYDNANILSSTVFADIQSSRKGLLKDIILECSLPDHFNDELELVFVLSGNIETLRLTRISPTKWKAIGNINFDRNAGYMSVAVHSEEGGDEAFLVFTAEEIYTMACTEKETPAERVFLVVKQDNPIGVKMTFTLSSSSTLLSGFMDAATRLNALQAQLVILHIVTTFQRRFEETGNVDDITQVISLYERALAISLIPPGLPVNPTISYDLGNSYAHRFECTRNLQDLERAISHHQSAVESTPSGHANQLNELGTLYLRRFECAGDFQDIDRAISHLQSVVGSTPSEHAGLPRIFNNLGSSYLCHFKRTGDLHDIDHAISLYQTAVKTTPSGHDDLPDRFGGLGASYYCRYKCTGDLQDIDCAISHQQSAVESTPSGHANLSRRLNNLGNLYIHRFKHTGNLDDIGCAISHHQTAVETTPSGHADLPSRFTSLGRSYLHRIERTGDLQDIDRAISHHQTAVETTPPGHADLPSRFNDLGTSYSCRFEHTGDLQDIDRAISYHQTAVKSIPSDRADLAITNLGTSYLRRFEYTGNLSDIDCAISHYQTVAESTPSGNDKFLSRFNNLGASYLRRFRHTSDLQDIDHAISHLRSAIESTPSGHTDLPSSFNNLGTSYACRFERTGDPQDIDCAISHHHTAVESTASDHAELPTFYTNLGSSYLRRFHRMRNIQDIDHAISHHQSAVKSTPSGHANLPSWLNNLGNSYSYRFEHTGDLQDIDYAISNYQTAIESTPPDHADIPGRFNNLGRLYFRRFERDHYFPDVQNSIASYRQAAAANGTPYIRLDSADLAAELSSIYDESHCLTDFALAISLLSEVAGLEQTIHRRHANLHGRSDLVGSAVATALHFNKADLALEWLEQGRCLVWNQLHQLRSPIGNLRVKNPPLADRFIKVASALESYGTRSILSIPPSDATLAGDIRIQNDARNHSLHAAEYKQLLKEIRDLPGFHDFLQPPKASDLLSSIPSDGPVIIFNINDTRCDALALVSAIEEPIHIPLKEFSLTQAKQLQETLQFGPLRNREVEDLDRMPQRIGLYPSSISTVLKELWYKVVQPIFEALGYSSPPDFLDRRRIWWCPTGPLAFLPLHAAGIYGSAYQRGSCSSLVLVSQPNAPCLPPIPWAKKETQDLEALMKETVDTLLLEDSTATREKVKEAMMSCSWAHFACHGVQDVSQPLESGLCVYDGRLELLEIMKQTIPNPDLAFLSACQTSKGDLKLSEEVVHLTAGMLAVGYRGVVGTMWSISDRHGPEFAMEFYKYLLSEKGFKGLDSTRASYALDHATRKVRERLGEMTLHC
ncbi:hypothetical protein BYT27DRAFT_7238250 [Phlegmacium glaucopus]|nr:hypothetical protein BYT27DRAFT_7238250 [Phlegmacium glaucopus]